MCHAKQFTGVIPKFIEPKAKSERTIAVPWAYQLLNTYHQLHKQSAAQQLASGLVLIAPLTAKPSLNIVENFNAYSAPAPSVVCGFIRS